MIRLEHQFFCKNCNFCKYYVQVNDNYNNINNLNQVNYHLDIALKNSNFGVYKCVSCDSMNYWGPPNEIEKFKKLIEFKIKNPQDAAGYNELCKNLDKKIDDNMDKKVEDNLVVINKYSKVALKAFCYFLCVIIVVNIFPHFFNTN